MEDYNTPSYETFGNYGLRDFIKDRFSSKRNIFTSFLVLFMLLAGLGAGVVLVRQTQFFRQKAAGGGVSLSLVPATTSVDPGQQFTLSIMLDPAGNNVSAASLIVSYPSDKLSLQGVDPGAFFMKNYDATTTGMLNKINQSTGSVTVTLGAPCSKQSPWLCYPRSDVDTFATLRFTALAGGTAAVSFSGQSQIAATASTTNVLGTTAGATITISGPTTPTPTPTPLPTITSIVGFVDRASCDNPDTAGWATDNRNHAQKLTMRLEAYPNGEPSNKIIRSGAIANGYRSDLGGVCPPDAKCAYAIKMGYLPISFLNKQIKIDVYGVAPDGQNILTGSGKIIGPCNSLVAVSSPTPTSAPTPTSVPTPTPTPAPVINTSINGNVDVENCTWAAGWARDQRNYANKVSVRAEAAPSGEPTNIYSVTAPAVNVRSDLTGVCPPSGACSFGAIWNQFPSSFANKKINVTVWGVATDGAQNIIKYAGGNTGTIGPCTNIKSP